MSPSQPRRWYETNQEGKKEHHEAILCPRHAREVFERPSFEWWSAIGSPNELECEMCLAEEKEKHEC